MRTNLAAARRMHLDRAARTAGMAFALDEPDGAPSARRALGANALWLGTAVVAGIALWLGL